MTPRRVVARAALALATALAVAACSGGAGDDAPSATPSCASDLRVGVAFGPGGRGDLGRNDLANAGIQQAIADGLVCEGNVRTNEPDATAANLEANLRALAESDLDLVIAIGPDFSAFVAGAAAEFPDVRFVVIDGSPSNLAEAGSNVANLRFRVADGAFLVGAAAALRCDCDALGFLGLRQDPDARAAEVGFAAGAREVRATARVRSTYLPADADPTAVRDAAEALYDAGVEVVFVAAGPSSGGAFAAAVLRRGWAVGEGTDAYLTATGEQQGRILTSMLRRVDAAVLEAIRTASSGAFVPGERLLGLADNAVGYSTANPELTTAIVGDLERLRQDVLTGEAAIPDAA